MNNSRSNEPQTPSPSTGTRARIGHVVRWHAEPVATEGQRDPREGNEGADAANVHAARPL